jgi:hypothetical protein
MVEVGFVTGTHAFMTDPLRETEPSELRASGVPFLLTLVFRVF